MVFKPWINIQKLWGKVLKTLKYGKHKTRIVSWTKTSSAMHYTWHYTIRDYTLYTSYRLFLRQPYCWLFFWRKKKAKFYWKWKSVMTRKVMILENVWYRVEKKYSDDSLHLSNSSMCYYTFDNSAVKSWKVLSFDEILFQWIAMKCCMFSLDLKLGKKCLVEYNMNISTVFQKNS